MATIHDIARFVNKSPATVSRALNNNKLISEKTRRQIAAAAKKLGYRPSITARNLHKGRTMTIGLGIFDLMNPYHVEYTRIVETLLNQKGYELLIVENLVSKDRLKRSVEVMLRQGCDGVILNCGPYKEEMIKEFLDSNVAVFLYGYPKRLEHLKVDGLNPSNTCYYEAISYLLELGHRNIKLIQSVSEMEGQNDEYDSILSFIKSKGYDNPNDLHFYTEGSNQLEDGYLAATKLLDDHPETTAIICTNDYNAVGVMKVLYERKIRVPEDISVIASNNTWIGKYWHIPLTTMDLNKSQCAQMSVHTLLRRIESGLAKTPNRFIIPTRLVIRDSTGPVRNNEFLK